MRRKLGGLYITLFKAGKTKVANNHNNGSIKKKKKKKRVHGESYVSFVVMHYQGEKEKRARKGKHGRGSL
jgi:hypothetical protein